MTEIHPLIVPSVVSMVTLFEDRAEVARKVRVTVPAGTSWVHAKGVTLTLDDPSLLASTKSPNARVVSARVLRRVREEPRATESEIVRLEEARVIARGKRIEVQQSLSRAEANQARLVSLEATLANATKDVPRGSDAASDVRAGYTRLGEAMIRGLDETSKHKGALEAASDDETRADLRLTQGRLVEPHYEAVVEVLVEASQPTDVEIDLVYRTPCALWRPEHMARLVESDVVIRTWATVWQITGEEWKDIPCRFSTARPAESASPPVLTDDVLQTRKKTDSEKKMVVLEARDQTISLAGVDRGTRDTGEMPGVEDGGEPLTFTSKSSATIPSDGRPFRVEIAETTVRATVERVAFPERGEAAHLRATATLVGDVPLLAGPVWIARGTDLVGRSRVKFVGKGEPFELGFGVDDGNRVRRKVKESKKTTPITGTQNVEREVTLYFSNAGGASRTLTATERVPVSEVEDVTITLESGPRPDKDGFVRFEVELAPNATKTVTLKYKIEAASKVVLPA